MNVVLESKRIALEIKCNFESCADTITRRENDKASKANIRALKDDNEKMLRQNVKEDYLKLKMECKVEKNQTS